MTETDHQILLMCWAKKISLAGRVELDLLFHIPNGGGRSKREAGVLKAMGVKAGVTDLFLPVPAGGKHGLWIEMKRPGGDGETAGRISEAQERFLEAVVGQGYAGAVCDGWRAAVEVLKGYLGGVWPDVDMGLMENRLGGGKK